jgi:hypothetical protein
MKATPERVELARQFLEQWKTIGRKHGTAVEWLQLKFSCSSRQALALYDAAVMAEPTKSGPPERGYSRAFTARGNTGKKYLLDDIPAGLWRDVKAKSKRTGVSIRAKVLSDLTAWVAQD